MAEHPTRSLWQHRNFLHLWAAQAMSAFGSRISRTVLPFIAVLSTGASPAQMGVLAALAVAPGIVVGLTMGGFVDRRQKRGLLIACDLIRAGLLFSIPVAFWLAVLSIEQLYFVAALSGAATVLFRIADNAYLPALIGKPRLVEGNAKLESTDAVAEVAGPSAGGVLLDLLGPVTALIVDAATYLISAASLGRIRSHEAIVPSPGRPPSLATDIAVGWRTVFRHPLLRTLILIDAAAAFSDGVFAALYMLYVIQTLGLSAAVIGLLIGIGGLGALIGTVIAGRVGRHRHFGAAMTVLLLGGHGLAVLIPLAALGPTLWTVAALGLHQLLGDALLVAYTVHAVSLRQTVLAPALLGRVNATDHVVTGALLPAGALIGGGLAGWAGLTPLIWLAVAGGLITVVIAWVSPLRRLKARPLPGTP